MDGGVWWAAVHGVVESRIRPRDFTFTFHFHALKKEMANHSSVLAWRIPGTGEPGGPPSMGSHRVRHDWSDLVAAAAAADLLQVSQGAGKVVWYSPLFKNFPQFVVIHTIKVFSIVIEAKVDVFLELSCFFYDPTDVGNLHFVAFWSGSSAFSKSSL